MKQWLFLACTWVLATTATADDRIGADTPMREEAIRALDLAVKFFHSEVAIHGGYVWRYSSDLQYRQGEGLAYDDRIWVQPPGTPTVGLAFRKANQATNKPKHLTAARAAAGDQKYLASAMRGGEFLLRAQMPQPQPAWAQCYDRNMQPVWDRAFEPPAIASLESQYALETLLLLYRRTGNERFLKAVPKAMIYLLRSRLEDGKLARFYELKSNRPLYFTKNHRMTYEIDPQATHYQFVVNSRLDAIVLKYRILARDGHRSKWSAPTREELAEGVHCIIHEIDPRGAWTEPGWVRDSTGRKIEPDDGILRSQTFVDHVTTLSQFIQRTD